MIHNSLANSKKCLGLALGLLLAAGVLACAGCGRKSGGAAGQTAIQIKGSDTLVNVAQSWAEQYAKVDPSVNVEVAGGGSGVGIAALDKGAIDIATASREMKPEEKAALKKNTGQDAREFVIGHDALAVYVHKDNPLEEISLDQLAAVFAEGGSITRWSQLGVTVPPGQDDIIRISRQSSSGTYEFFRDFVLKKKDFKLGSRDMNGSKEVVELVGGTPAAIGYSGMGYATPAVKKLRIATVKGAPSVAPTVENTLNKSYPLARALYLYTAGEPQGAIRKFVDWVLSPAGQKIMAECGYVPVTPAAPAK